MTPLIQSCWTCPEKTTQAPAGPQALCPCALSLAAAWGWALTFSDYERCSENDAFDSHNQGKCQLFQAEPERDFACC